MDYNFINESRRLEQEYRNIIASGSRLRAAQARIQLKLLLKMRRELAAAQTVTKVHALF